MTTDSPIIQFLKTIAALRHPETGCPWDLKQTHSSLAPYAVEETYELVDAINSGIDEELKEELGDVLLQVVLHSQLASERNSFSFDDVVSAINEKIIRRHPHVFGDVTASNTEEVIATWEAVKQTEKSETKNDSILSGIPRSMPGLERAHHIGKRAARANFDWKNIESVWEKVKEEFAELQHEFEERRSEDSSRVKEELGDLLFSLSQFARWLDTSAEDCSIAACRKFESRFRKLEQELGVERMNAMDTDELEKHWQSIKKAT